MTLLELQNVLGEQISAMVNGTADGDTARQTTTGRAC